MFDIREEEAIMRPRGGRRLTGIRPTFGVQMIPQSSSRQLWRLSDAKIAGFGDLFQALVSQMLETLGGRLGECSVFVAAFRRGVRVRQCR